ncbi:hypothetical protein SELMODRAFT_425418 [Selaginella moellendorffii]|uniref:Uncharacterized protein n=1 Tax=Selaginella moellendorffii TaxID=88036 RepID=D8ST17_SELML|nr:hypothetical protein SELMODRAFT_425418 [Selaginella moellendorffii]
MAAYPWRGFRLVGYDAEPGEANFEPWATTNMDYGKFYSFYKPDFVKRPSTVHAECEKKYDMLLKELMECKAQLDQLRAHNSATDDGPPSHRSDVSCEEQEHQQNSRKAASTPSPRLSDLLNETSTQQQQVNATEATNKDSKNRVTIKSAKHKGPSRNLLLKQDAFDRLSRPKTAPVRHLDYLRSSRGKPHPIKYDQYKYFGRGSQGSKKGWEEQVPPIRNHALPQVPPLRLRRRPQY